MTKRVRKLNLDLSRKCTGERRNYEKALIREQKEEDYVDNLCLDRIINLKSICNKNFGKNINCIS
jgi:hypothetical protein